MSPQKRPYKAEERGHKSFEFKVQGSSITSAITLFRVLTSESGRPLPKSDIPKSLQGRRLGLTLPRNCSPLAVGVSAAVWSASWPCP